jgi:hypothetical protein
MRRFLTFLILASAWALACQAWAASASASQTITLIVHPRAVFSMSLLANGDIGAETRIQAASGDVALIPVILQHEGDDAEWNARSLQSRVIASRKSSMRLQSPLDILAQSVAATASASEVAPGASEWMCLLASP